MQNCTVSRQPHKRRCHTCAEGLAVVLPSEAAGVPDLAPSAAVSPTGALTGAAGKAALLQCPLPQLRKVWSSPPDSSTGCSAATAQARQQIVWLCPLS